MGKARMGALAVTLLAACFDENTPVDPTAGMDGTASASGTQSGPTSTASGPWTDTEPGSSTGSTTSNTSLDGTATETGSSTGEPLPIQCDDGLPAPGELCFGDTTVVMANDSTFSARIGQVSGTSDADVVHLITDQVVVRVGDGDGNFGPAVFDASVVSQRMTLADLDEDGELDVVTVENAGALRVLLGSGAGSFAPSSQVATGADPQALVLGDLDADGHLDAVVGTGSGAMLYPLRGDGSGGLLPAPAISSEGAVTGLALADFDGDGSLDLALTVDGGGWQGAAVRLGLGDGTFMAQQTTPGQMPGAHGIATGDFDGDGRADIAYVSQSMSALGVLLGDGNGGFAAEQVVATGAGPQVLHADDLDNDGRPDLVVAHQGESTLRVFVMEPGVGPVEGLQIPLAAAVTALDSGDVDGDGVPDLVATSTGAHIVTIVLSTP